MKTKTRILEAARELFNAEGTAAVSTNHIAAALGISPGNLYYHYANKDAIIDALAEQLFATWERELVLPADRLPTLADLRALVRINFAILWDYRWIYRELIVLLRQNAALHARYVAVRARGFADFQQMVEALGAAGVLALPADRAAVTRLAELCWLISEGWLPQLEISGREINEAALEQGVALMLQVLEPLLITKESSYV